MNSEISHLKCSYLSQEEIHASYIFQCKHWHNDINHTRYTHRVYIKPIYNTQCYGFHSNFQKISRRLILILEQNELVILNIPQGMSWMEVIVKCNVWRNTEYGYQSQTVKAQCVAPLVANDLIWLIPNDFVWGKAKQLAQPFHDQCGLGDFHAACFGSTNEQWIRQEQY